LGQFSKPPLPIYIELRRAGDFDEDAISQFGWGKIATIFYIKATNFSL
jgi:hypothetical protein